MVAHPFIHLIIIITILSRPSVQFYSWAWDCRPPIRTSNIWTRRSIVPRSAPSPPPLHYHHHRSTTFSFTTTRLLLKSTRMSTLAAAATAAAASSPREWPPTIPGRPTWQQTMIRIKDPTRSLAFYTGHLGMTLLDKLDFPQYQFTVYFLTTRPATETTYNLTPGTQPAHDHLWNLEGTTLELTHNYGTENEESFAYHPGNQERDGFGHIAVSVNDVYDACDRLEKAGYTFKKKPDEGRMKGLAFVYDPDGYWVEIVARGNQAAADTRFPYYNWSQTMLRIKDPQPSLAFYCGRLGMQLVDERHFDDFSLYFLASSNVHLPAAEEAGGDVVVKNLFHPVLELTHNHGTEKDDSFRHYHGNEEGRRGFGHVGFLVDDVYAACDALRPDGYGFKKEPDGGAMKGLAFAYDPDGYWIELIPRGGIDLGDAQVGK